MHKQATARDLTRFTPLEIKTVLYQGRSVYQSTELGIKAVRVGQSYGKILVITPKKIGSAPKRNLLKRRLKSIFYEEKLYTYPYNIAVLAKKGSTLLTFGLLKAILVSCSTHLKPHENQNR